MESMGVVIVVTEAGISTIVEAVAMRGVTSGGTGTGVEQVGDGRRVD